MKESIQRAMEDARQELIRIEADIEELARLQARKQTLEVFLAAARDVIRGEDGLASPSGLSSVKVGDINPDRLWEAIQIVMGMEGQPMTAGETLIALTSQRVRVEGVHKRESVRSAMHRREDIFEKVGRGLYALRVWPDHIKRSREKEEVDDEIA